MNFINFFNSLILYFIFLKLLLNGINLSGYRHVWFKRCFLVIYINIFEETYFISSIRGQDWVVMYSHIILGYR